MSQMAVCTAPVAVAPEPAMTSPGKQAGYGPLRAIRRTTRGLGWKKLATRLCTVNIQPQDLPADLTRAVQLQHITHTYT